MTFDRESRKINLLKNDVILYILKYFWRRRKFMTFLILNCQSFFSSQLSQPGDFRKSALINWYRWGYKGDTPNRTSSCNCWNARQWAREQVATPQKAQTKRRWQMHTYTEYYNLPEAPESTANRSLDPAHHITSKTTWSLTSSRKGVVYPFQLYLLLFPFL